MCEMGACAEFCIYHLITLKSGEEGASRILDDSLAASNGQRAAGSPMFSWKMVEYGDAECGHPDPYQPLLRTDESNLPAPRHELRPLPDPPTYLNLSNPLILSDIAPVIRSKNAGPYEITLDVLFSNEFIYSVVKSSKLLTSATIAQLYHSREDEIIYCGFYDQAMAFKATIPRKKNGKIAPSGGFMETDVHGSQQYVGLLELELSEDVKLGVSRLVV